MKLELHPPSLIALQQEIDQHPPLVEILSGKQVESPDDFAEWVAAVGTYAGLLLDGLYDAKDMAGICNKLTELLYKKRTSLIIPEGVAQVKH